MKKIIICMLLMSVTAQAGQYAYHPFARLYLAGGFNPYFPDRAYLPCIDHDGEHPVETDGAVGSEVEISLVTNRQDLYQKINISASLSGSYTFYSGSASERYEDEQAFHSDSLTWIVSFKTNYGHYALRNPRLSPSLSTMSEDDLYTRCGSEIVTERKKGVMLFALFTIKNLSQTRRTELERKFNASAKGPIWSAKMSAQYSSIFRSGMATSDISLKIHAVGGDGITNLTGLIKNGEENSFIAYEQLPQILSNYLSTMTARKAAPTQNVTALLTSFKPGVTPRYEDFKNGQLISLYTNYLNYSSVVNRIRSILVSPDDAFIMSDEERIDLEKAESVYTNNMNLIYAAAKTCFTQSSENCRLPTTNNAKFVWPKARPTDEHCSSLRQYAYVRGLVSESIFKMATARNFAPIINAENGQIEGWGECQSLFQ